MDPFIYKIFNKDLQEFNDHDLHLHYCIYGQFEDRIINLHFFDEKYPNFNPFIYRKIYSDLKDYNDLDTKIHYHFYGQYEDRITNLIFFENKYPDFSANIYYKVQTDLKEFNEQDLKIHYHFYGQKNIFNSLSKFTNDFSLNNPDFDLELYRNFNESLKDFSHLELMIHYIMIGSISNTNYLKYDFIVENYYEGIEENNPLYETIKNHHYYRKFDNYDDLFEYNKQFIKKFYIYNKKFFYLYYPDFDVNYYSNRYFKDENLSELEIMNYYHNIGRNQKHIINNKYKIIIYTPPFDIKCGGIVVMHYLPNLINIMKNDKFYGKLFIYNNLKYDNIFCTDFAKIDEIDDNTIVIYPETISGNPLNAKNVVRWILLDLGIEMPVDHYKNWNPNDLVYFWEARSKKTNNFKKLRYHWLNPIFTNKNLEKYKTCYLIKKGSLIHCNINYMHPNDSICIENLSLNEIANIFNECKYFYCYDPNTMYIIYAIFCGCIPIIYPIENMSKDDYCKRGVFYKDNIIYNKGFAWGDSIEEINYAKETLFEANKEIKELFESDKESINSFLNDIEIYFNEPNNEKLSFCKDVF